MNDQTTQGEEMTVTQADEYRSYFDVIRPPAPPRAAFADIELLAATYPLRIFTMRSAHSLEAVLAPGYFRDLADCRLRRQDRIELVADFHGAGHHALLVVDHVDKSGGDIRVSLLCRYERAA